MHISLGVFLRLFELLENAAHELDVMIAQALGRKTQQLQELRQDFVQHVGVLRRIAALTEEANEESDHADFLDSICGWAVLSSESVTEDLQIAAMREEARSSRRKADELVSLDMHTIAECSEVVANAF